MPGIYTTPSIMLWDSVYVLQRCTQALGSLLLPLGLILLLLLPLGLPYPRGVLARSRALRCADRGADAWCRWGARTLVLIGTLMRVNRRVNAGGVGPLN